MLVTSLRDWISTTFSAGWWRIIVRKTKKKKAGRLRASEQACGEEGELDFDPIMVIPPWMTLWSDLVYPHTIDFLCRARHSHTETQLMPLEYNACSLYVGINIITSSRPWRPAGRPASSLFHFHFALTLSGMTQRPPKDSPCRGR